MTVDNINTVFFCCLSLIVGALLGMFRSKLFAAKTENWFHIVFYVASGIAFFTCLIISIMYASSISGLGWTASVIVMLASIFLVWFTYKYLIIKTVYAVKELDPIINKFTEDADKDEIRLFGGDLNFFGDAPNDVDKNPQYNTLKAQGFKKVYILCVPPKDYSQKVRYGKLYHEIKNLELKYYDPELADLKVRGRIIRIQGIIKLLIYTKHDKKQYETISTDTSNAKGLLYDNIWHLTWSLAKAPTQEEIKDYLKCYNEH